MGNVLCCCSEPVDFDGEVDLYHFDLLRAVGKGAFGKVRVVQHKRSHKMYALKYIEKSKCIKQKAVANIIQERRLLEEIDHPFVVNLRYAFQDDENCYFVLDLMLGGDLRFHLDRLKRIPEDTVRFWTAELSSALSYMHKQRIVHRDLKPDNILLDELGHVHITDFNVAIHYSERRLHTSVAGSMAYMAPEVIGQTGYTWCVDWWSLGVVVWELLFRKRPFDGHTADKMKSAITKGPIRFPTRVDEYCSVEAQDFLHGLLDRNYKTRLGCRKGRGVRDIRSHPWFASMDWESLENKEIQPPYVPDRDKANFDVSHELDEFLMVEKPLTHSKRKKANRDLDKMKPEMRQLEEQFTVYDFSKHRRKSYYPHNQPIAFNVHETDTEHSEVIQSTTNTLQPTATIIARSRACTPSPDYDGSGRESPPTLPAGDTVVYSTTDATS